MIHEGIDTDVVTPRVDVRFHVPGTQIELSAADEVVTYVARNLEPYRGFPSFMRRLPAILTARPNAHVLVVGGAATSYGPGLADGRTFRQELLDELGDSLDRRRVHFLGKVPYPDFLRILQISTAHVYLTYPFVLSWSMLESMAAGCLVIGSRTAPVQEVIRDGENGILVDFFSPQNIADRVIHALCDRLAFSGIRENARRTIIDNYDLRSVCLPRQLALIDTARQGRA